MNSVSRCFVSGGKGFDFTRIITMDEEASSLSTVYSVATLTDLVISLVSG